MNNNVHSRQPFDPRTEGNNSPPLRERRRDDKDRGRDDIREGPRKKFDKDLKKAPPDRRREDDRRRDDRDPWEWRDRRDERMNSSGDDRKSPRGPPTSTQRDGRPGQLPEDVLWEANSLQSASGNWSSMSPLSPKSPKSPKDPNSPRRRSERRPEPTPLSIKNQAESNDFPEEHNGGSVRLSLHSEQQQYQKWLELAELGELDVYTCLGLSDASTWTVDTQVLVFKILSALMLQCLIPIGMLYLQLVQFDRDPEVDERRDNFLADILDQLKDHLRPASDSVHFRVIGCAMLLYTLWSMYNGALDECRSSLLHYCIEKRVNYGIWWPCLLGEVANLLVSMVLMTTLYFLFVNQSDGAYLVLNAVAVNFLCDIDQEFVDRDIFSSASKNFKKLSERYKDRPPNDRNCSGKVLEAILSLARMLFVCLGVVLSLLFLFAPDKSGGMWYHEMMGNSTDTDM